MAQQDPEPTEVNRLEELEARLTPEERARREAALRLVRTYGDPALRAKARPIERFDAKLAAEARRMGQIMHDSIGIGLAATQLGMLHRLLVYRVEPDAPIAVVVNPEIEWTSDDEEVLDEGCLSLPRVLVDVERPIHVRVRARDETGAPRLIEASGLEARVLQHEIDHLDGVLILDRTSRDQRKRAMRILREADEAAA